MITSSYPTSPPCHAGNTILLRSKGERRWVEEASKPTFLSSDQAGVLPPFLYGTSRVDYLPLAIQEKLLFGRRQYEETVEESSSSMPIPQAC